MTFLREANMMLKFSHKNVVQFYGVCMQKEPVMIVMEMAPGLCPLTPMFLQAARCCRVSVVCHTRRWPPSNATRRRSPAAWTISPASWSTGKEVGEGTDHPP